MRRAFAALVAFAALGFPGAARGAGVPADPWPRQFKSGNATILVYQPQVESWIGNTITFRSAIAVRKADPKDDVFGVIFAKARAQVDKASRIVLLEEVVVTKRDFPTLPDNGLLYLFSLKTQLGPSQRTVSLDRLEASLAASGSAAPPAVEVNNDPPRILVSDVPAILVRIDGPPALRPLPNTTFRRVINTRAVLLADEGAGAFYLRVGNAWLTAASLGGPWIRPDALPDGLEAAARPVEAARVADLLVGRDASASPSTVDAPPAVFVSETPAALIVFEGNPAFTPVTGTDLARASNTASNVLLETESNQYFVLLSGRWFRAASLSGPWSYVPGSDLPADFRRIPPDSPAGAVLAAVAGTPQAAEALIANAIPQTAVVSRVGGPTFAPRFDGTPQTAPIDGTALRYVVNSPTPIIQAAARDFYAVRDGVWFTSPALSGSWVVAATLPDAIATIPPDSPLHFVTDVRIYGVTIGFVYEGYTPGYLGSISTPGGVVVHGTGYVYPPWIGSAWYPYPATYASWGGPGSLAGGNLYGAYGTGVSSEVRSAFFMAPGGTVYTNTRAGKSSPYGIVEARNDVYVDKDGQVFSNGTGSWQQHSADGWSGASGDTGWADREARARSAGEEAFRELSQSAASAGGTPRPSGNSSR
jgi:hypothetical protein